ncbi:tyrosine-type recombinase/integrase [Methylopila musalis]|uniref:Tyrosine-type recombinase/integrase n=1 Tax=Methylopila musalis TaxID=1134781 RepID=A0ABW3Z4A3_9HYPH
MAKTLNRLSARFVKTATEPGRYADGGNLYLSVSPTGAKSWVFMYRLDRRQREAGLGSAQSLSLAAARDVAQRMREQLAQGHDPIAARDADQRPAVPKFGDFADQFVTNIESEFRNEKHIYQWRQTLGPAYCASIRNKKVDEITSDDVLRILQPLWATKQETASRLRGRLERIFDSARAKGLRTGENPATWKGNLKELLPARQKLQYGHQPALPYTDVPAFVGRLRERKATTALALEFLILTAARANEVFGATWSEIDIDNRLWTVPAARMKRGKQHSVPLPKRALAILQEVKLIRQTPEGSAFERGLRPAHQAHGRGRLRAARLPIFIPRLVRRLHEISARDRRSGLGPCDRERSRTSLPSTGCDRKAP